MTQRFIVLNCRSDGTATGIRPNGPKRHGQRVPRLTPLGFDQHKTATPLGSKPKAVRPGTRQAIPIKRRWAQTKNATPRALTSEGLPMPRKPASLPSESQDGGAKAVPSEPEGRMPEASVRRRGMGNPSRRPAS